MDKFCGEMCSRSVAKECCGGLLSGNVAWLCLCGGVWVFLWWCGVFVTVFV